MADKTLKALELIDSVSNRVMLNHYPKYQLILFTFALGIIIRTAPDTLVME